MNRDNWITLGLALYLALFAVAVALTAHYRIRRSKVRAPLDFKLLRAPGESLRRRMAKFDEDLFFRLARAGLAPLVATFPIFLCFQAFKPSTWTELYIWLGASALIFVIVLILAFKWALRDFGRYRNDRLGYLGERAVGEALESLREQGFRIFHDLPAEAGGHDFNVDHVVVGTSGVFAVETKTRRKGRARPGFEDHKVAYDGTQLIWPWAEDTFGLENSVNRARWLTDWLNRMTGLGLTAKPVLVLPGWYVVPKAIGPVIVVNHKQVPGAILRQPRGVLTGDQVDLIARQLEERCRDVVD